MVQLHPMFKHLKKLVRWHTLFTEAPKHKKIDFNEAGKVKSFFHHTS